ncbi:MAG: hypothetical protein U0414_41950 [Polyangiaceae bacterium]
MPRPLALLLGSILAAIGVGCVQEVDLLGAGSEGTGGAGAELRFLELFADDPLRRTADLENGVYGSVLQDGEIRNRNGELDFGWYHAGEFTVGIQGGDAGFILDLGTDADLGLALGSGGSGFGALHLSTAGGASTFGYAPADAVFDAGTADHALVAQAHVYVIRIGRAGGDLVFKALAADLTSPTRVVLDWLRLR